VWLAAAVPAHACSCAGQTDETIRQTGLIVVGTVHDLRFAEDVPPGPTAEPGVTPPPVLSPNGARVVWTLAVEEYIKGSGASEIDVYSNAGISYNADGEPSIYPGSTPACQYAPEDGARYLFILSSSADGVHETGACSGSTIITPENEAQVAEYVQRIRDALASPEAFPDTGVGPPSRNGPFPTVAAASVAVALAAAVLLSSFSLRIRRER
jgi:hypothetical protein